MRIDEESFGRTPEGEPVQLFTLENDAGLRVRVAGYGGIVVSLEAPDRRGERADLVLGFDRLDGYLGEHPYLGALVGRYANRIAGARFDLDGETHRLAANEGRNCLHGGPVGFDRAVWRAEAFREAGAVGLRLRHHSPDGDQGFPGALDAEVHYRLGEANELRIDFRARCDRATPVNLTHHGYFNLAGHDAGDILAHELELPAERFTPVGPDMIPTGEQRPVAGTPFDFRARKPIGRDIDAADDQLRGAGGYDHNFAVLGTPGTLRLAGRVWEPASGRALEIHTTQPGVQLYTGNGLDGSLVGKGGARYGPRAALCLETQHFPDAPNQPGFASAVVRPGEGYAESALYRFGCVPKNVAGTGLAL